MAQTPQIRISTLMDNRIGLGHSGCHVSQTFVYASFLLAFTAPHLVIPRVFFFFWGGSMGGGHEGYKGGGHSPAPHLLFDARSKGGVTATLPSNPRATLRAAGHRDPQTSDGPPLRGRRPPGPR